MTDSFDPLTSNWTSGYVADIDYTYGYYAELNPFRSEFVLLNSGVVFPKYTTACELGFGQGLSTNIHASATDVEWYGTDFNPSQAGFAQELVRNTQSNAKLYDEAFEEFCSRKDLPEFDFICLHGIWSWISNENRKTIVNFIRRKLKVGGILYVSYNTQPGWAGFAPLRHLMTQHAEVVGSRGSGTIGRVDGAIEFAERLLATNPLYASAVPQIKERVKLLKEQNRHYLAHEYFNLDWEPMHFSTVAQWLKSAKLDFACSANYLDHIGSINLTDEQSQFLQSIPDLVLRESVRDFMVNSQFRKDYWIRGLRKLSVYEQSELIRNFRVILRVERNDIEIKLSGALREAVVNLEIYDPILDILSDHKPKTIQEISDTLGSRSKINFKKIVESILVLISTGHVEAARSDENTSNAKVKTDLLNQYILKKAKSGNEIGYVSSPVTGGGIKIDYLIQNFLFEYKQGLTDPRDIARATWKQFSERGQNLIVDGKELKTAEENLAELNKGAKVFIENQLKLIKSLQII